jgi:dihydropteroate synthase
MIRDQAPTTANRSLPTTRATSWQLRTRTLQFADRPLLMGIVNVTPDSFSDGGQFSSPAAAISQVEKLVREGADLIDIGGESTRPGAQPVSEQEELDRVLPVIEAACKSVSVPISVDTSKAAVAEAALAAGAEIVNDITALRGDSRMLDVMKRADTAVCIMHMQGTPQTMQVDPQYRDVVGEVLQFLKQSRDQLISAGIEPQRICVDPGIGFGKTADHNLALLQNSSRLHELGCPVLVGYSRKSFLSHIAAEGASDRTAAGLNVARALAAQGVQILRVHDVTAVRQALAPSESVYQQGRQSD